MRRGNRGRGHGRVARGWRVSTVRRDRSVQRGEGDPEQGFHAGGFSIRRRRRGRCVPRARATESSACGAGSLLLRVLGHVHGDLVWHRDLAGPLADGAVRALASRRRNFSHAQRAELVSQHAHDASHARSFRVEERPGSIHGSHRLADERDRIVRHGRFEQSLGELDGMRESHERKITQAQHGTERHGGCEVRRGEPQRCALAHAPHGSRSRRTTVSRARRRRSRRPERARRGCQPFTPPAVRPDTSCFCTT